MVGAQHDAAPVGSGSDSRCAGTYGATDVPALKVHSIRQAIPEYSTGVLACIFVPSGLFAVVYAALSLVPRGDYRWLCWLVGACSFFAVLAVGTWAYRSAIQLACSFPSGLTWPRAWPGLLLASSLAAWAAAILLGGANWESNARLYMEYVDLNTYVDVDPIRTAGSEVVDAGRIFFVPGSRVNASMYTAMRNGNVYCVAPITSGLGSKQLDFWAVGVDCCNDGAFRCGEAADTQARGGLRLLDGALQGYFKRAVMQATTQYDLQAPHPLFLHWLHDPVSPVKGYWRAGVGFVLIGVFAYLAAQSVLVAVAVLSLDKARFDQPV